MIDSISTSFVKENVFLCVKTFKIRNIRCQWFKITRLDTNFIKLRGDARYKTIKIRQIVGVICIFIRRCKIIRVPRIFSECRTLQGATPISQENLRCQQLILSKSSVISLGVRYKTTRSRLNLGWYQVNVWLKLNFSRLEV